MAAHRYWRVRNIYNPYGRPGIGELAFLDGSKVKIAGTIIVSSTYSPTYAASNMADNDPGTYWTGLDGQSEYWAGYDFGSDVEPVQVKITAPTSYTDQAGVNFYIDYSDDGSTWTTHAKIEGFVKWGSGEARIFDLNFDAWKIKITSDYGGGYASLSEWRLMDGDASVCTPSPYNAADRYPYGANYSDYYANSDVKSLFDGYDVDSGGGNGYFVNGSNRYLIYRFPEETEVYGVYFKGRSGYYEQSPKDVEIYRSTDNGQTYTLEGTMLFQQQIVDYQEQTEYYRAPSPAPKKDRYRIRFTAMRGSNYAAINELQMRTSPGGSNVIGGGSIIQYQSLGGYYAALAFDGNTGETPYVANGAGAWAGYVWSDEKILAEYVIFRRNGYDDQLPKSWVFEVSEDRGVTWDVIDTQTDVDPAMFVYGVGTVFTVGEGGGPDPEPTGRRRYTFCA